MLVLDNNWQCFFIHDMFIASRSHHGSLFFVVLVRISLQDLPACPPLCYVIYRSCSSVHPLQLCLHPCIEHDQHTLYSILRYIVINLLLIWFTSSWSSFQQQSTRSHPGWNELQQPSYSLLHHSMFSSMTLVITAPMPFFSFSFFFVDGLKTHSTFTRHFCLVIHTCAHYSFFIWQASLLFLCMSGSCLPTRNHTVIDQPSFCTRHSLLNYDVVRHAQITAHFGCCFHSCFQVVIHCAMLFSSPILFNHQHVSIVLFWIVSFSRYSHDNPFCSRDHTLQPV